MLLLAMYFLLYGIASIIQAGVHFNYFSQRLFVVPSALHFIAYSFFYAHINSLLINASARSVRLIVKVGGGMALLGIGITACAFIADNWMVHTAMQLYDILTFLFLVLVTIRIIALMIKHNRLVKNQYSCTENRRLDFLLYCTVGFLLFILSFVLVDYSVVGILWERIIQTIISFAWTMGLVYNALLHQISINLFAERDMHDRSYINTADHHNALHTDTPKATVVKAEEQGDDYIEQEYKVEPLRTKEELPTIYEEQLTVEVEPVTITEAPVTTEEEPIVLDIPSIHTDLMDRIEDEIKSQELFLNPELTIANLADIVEEHPRLVSQVINTHTGQNFNTYINKYRVSYAKDMLINEENDHISIEGIGNMSGFKSNSSFYSAFKKELNITPLQFKKKHNI